MSERYPLCREETDKVPLLHAKLLLLLLIGVESCTEKRAVPLNFLINSRGRERDFTCIYGIGGSRIYRRRRNVDRDIIVMRYRLSILSAEIKRREGRRERGGRRVLLQFFASVIGARSEEATSRRCGVLHCDHTYIERAIVGRTAVAAGKQLTPRRGQEQTTVLIEE